MAAKPLQPDEIAMQSHPPRPGVPGREPLAFGAREHLSRVAPAARHASRLAVLGSVALAERSQHPLPPLLTLRALREWAELRAAMLQMDEAA
jgi:hypothetical protein